MVIMYLTHGHFAAKLRCNEQDILHCRRGGQARCRGPATARLAERLRRLWLARMDSIGRLRHVADRASDSWKIFTRTIALCGDGVQELRQYSFAQSDSIRT